MEVAKDDFATVRTGRANPQLFQKILVDYYGTPDAAGAAGVAEQPRGAHARRHARTTSPRCKAIEQAIRDTPNLGANPTNDGNVVRVTLPELTEERRREYVKIVRVQGRGREGRTCATSVARPRTTSTALKSEVGEDELARAEKELDALTQAPTSTRSTRRSSARKPSCSRSESTHDRRIRRSSGQRAAPGTAADPAGCRRHAPERQRSRAERRLPVACARRAQRVREPGRARRAPSSKRPMSASRQRTGRDLIVAILIGLAIGAAADRLADLPEVGVRAVRPGARASWASSSSAAR